MKTRSTSFPQWDICFSVTDEDINDLIKMRVILEQGAIREAMEKNANNVIVELSNILSKSAKLMQSEIRKLTSNWIMIFIMFL